MNRYLIAAGLLLVILGGTLGLVVSVNATGNQGMYSCGAPWTGSDPNVGTDFSQLVTGRAAVYSDYKGLCSDARQARGLVAVLIVTVGTIVAGAGLVQETRKRITEYEPLTQTGASDPG
jgi:hypothetical protein